MKIVFKGTIPKNHLLNIKMDKKSSFITSDIPSTSFNVDAHNVYKVKIYQDLSFETWWQKILLFVLYIILAPINIILMFNDDNWHEGIDPYCVEAEFDVVIEDFDKEINFEYIVAADTDVPVLSFDNELDVRQKTTENISDFDTKCNAYMMRIASIFLVTMALLSVIIYYSLENPIVVVVCALLLVFFIILLIVLSVRARRHCKSLKNSFKQRI